MKNIALLLFLFVFVSCSSSDSDEDDAVKNLGYYKGMSYSDYEYTTGLNVVDKKMKHHYSGLKDLYTLPSFNYFEGNGATVVNREDYVESKGFYPTLNFVFYGGKLVTIKVSFNHWGTIRSNESPMLYESEEEMVMSEIVKYFEKMNIDATFELTPYNEPNSYVINHREITGIVNL
ncbi:hypothetical protein LX69_02279 [Breznakibacter xylanolyticus]|uniref:Uncharacterized protein n=1 Tax=Breznakibacter xylanolyticus TaxID=990 RepID=A0A2W7N4E6_9BACT|nr:hypothetical protein [Breznakibacter xylanolyticus]PZX14951.1 hypothetical protein LX69_02279 [Breznakibacter xylanolyticus]